jgi:hypothetical protein
VFILTPSLRNGWVTIRKNTAHQRVVDSPMRTFESGKDPSNIFSEPHNRDELRYRLRQQSLAMAKSRSRNVASITSASASRTTSDNLSVVSVSPTTSFCAWRAARERPRDRLSCRPPASPAIPRPALCAPARPGHRGPKRPSGKRWRRAWLSKEKPKLSVSRWRTRKQSMVNSPESMIRPSFKGTKLQRDRRSPFAPETCEHPCNDVESRVLGLP